MNFGGIAGSTIGSVVLGNSSDAYFNFWNSDDQQWQSVDISLSPSESGMDSDGFTVTGEYDSSNDSVTVTVVPN